MAETISLTDKKGAKAALEDETVRLMYDLHRKVFDMVEQMQDGDDGMDDDERAEIHRDENALLGRAVAWLQAKGVSDPWRAGL